jgi:lysyl-tRNA synthetase class 2
MRVFHALAVPASLTLLALAHYLARRRRSALRLALGMLLVLVVANLAKGLDVEEAAVTLAGAALLWWGRHEFTAGPDRPQLRAALVRAAALALGAVAACVTVVRLTALDASWPTVARESVAALTWRAGPISFAEDLAFVPHALGLAGGVALLACLAMVLGPIAWPSRTGDSGADVERTVRTHGSDTLDFFKLRRDVDHIFDPSGRAFVAYRVDTGVLLCAGDPVGPDDALPGAIAAAVGLAERLGLRLGGVGVSEPASLLFARARLRRLYLGDEAVVETARFSLEGRPIRKVRQSVTRLERAGYGFDLVEHSSLGPNDLARLAEVSAAWLGGSCERGFSMALDALEGGHLHDTLVATATDDMGCVRGYLHFVPAKGGRAVSLSSMRRDPETPNGLTEFLVSRSIEELGRRGVPEVSLNFAIFARYMHAPRTTGEQVIGRIAALGNTFFQIESLFRFNAKFGPRWEPRYLVFESVPCLPRVGLAAAWAEGQLPRIGSLVAAGMHGGGGSAVRRAAAGV